VEIFPGGPADANVIVGDGSYHGENDHGRNGIVKVDKLSISFEPELADAVRSAAAAGDRIMTSDPRDLSRLAEAGGRRAVIFPC
jgi:hypothetical protein